MRRSSPGAVQPGQIGAHRIERAGGVGEEGGEQEQRHAQPDGQGRGEVAELEAARLCGRGGGVQPAVPKLVQAQGQRGGGQRDDERFLGRVHEAHARAGEQGPADLPAAPVTPAGGERQEGEEDQQDFVNVIAAVEDHRRGDGREQGGPDESRSGPGRRRPAAGAGSGPTPKRTVVNRSRLSVNWSKSFGAPVRRLEGEGGVIERRAVMLVGIVLIAAVLPELAELDAVDGLVVVHRALVQGQATTAPARGRPAGRGQPTADGRCRRPEASIRCCPSRPPSAGYLAGRP